MASTLDTRLEVSGLEAKLLVIEHLHFGIEHGSIRGKSAQRARRIVRAALVRILRHKQLSDQECEEIRARWGAYLRAQGREDECRENL